jgi:hypothetical protein
MFWAVIHVMRLGTLSPDKASWIKSPTMTTAQHQSVAGICVLVNPINPLGADMKIVKMDRRFALYHQGFTHQIRNTSLTERNELCSYFGKKYGHSSDFIFTQGMSVRQYNRNWRTEQAKRRFSGGTKIYVKHPEDLVMIGLKWGAKIG